MQSQLNYAQRVKVYNLRFSAGLLLALILISEVLVLAGGWGADTKLLYTMAIGGGGLYLVLHMNDGVRWATFQGQAEVPTGAILALYVLEVLAVKTSVWCWQDPGQTWWAGAILLSAITLLGAVL